MGQHPTWPPPVHTLIVDRQLPELSRAGSLELRSTSLCIKTDLRGTQGEISRSPRWGQTHRTRETQRHISASQEATGAGGADCLREGRWHKFKGPDKRPHLRAPSDNSPQAQEARELSTLTPCFSNLSLPKEVEDPTLSAPEISLHHPTEQRPAFEWEVFPVSEHLVPGTRAFRAWNLAGGK